MVNRTDEIQAQARKAVAVAPNDSADLPGGECRAVWVGTAGNISLILADDTEPLDWTILSVPAILPFVVRRVRSTGTTCTNIRALY